MHKIIAKYGLAAHLALLAVAPLVLSPLWGDEAVAVVLAWLTLVSAIWLFMEPSLRTGESLHVARKRVVKSVFCDVLFWCMLAVVVLAGVRAFNTGIGLAYDAENAKWQLSSAVFSLLPGSVGTAGWLPFAGTVSLLVVLQGCRHALGRSARMAFLLVAAILAGLGASLDFALTSIGHEVVKPTSDGLSFALYLLGGTVALAAAFERKWRFVMPLFSFAVGGTAAGAFAFSPVFAVAVFVGAEILVLSYVFLYAAKTLSKAGEFKLLVVMGISLALGGLAVAMLLPPDLLNAKLSATKELVFFPPEFKAVRAVLSEIARKSWFSRLWIGTGLESFPLDFRFSAAAADWALVRGQVISVPNGWWQLLAERGIVGVLAIALPTAGLLFFYVRRLLRAFPMTTLPHPACLLTPIVLAAVVSVGFFDSSILRIDALTAAGALLAVAAGSFVRGGGNDNG